jgi:predicted alpha-1,2-mannosidase
MTKIRLGTTLIIFILSFISIFAQKRGPSDLVNPFIGTGGHGHTYPGAVFPFGMVQLSSDTRLTGWDGCSAYHYTDTVTYGFSHTHLSGTGVSDYGDVLFMPYIGDGKRYESGKIGSRFQHAKEYAKPGFYACKLDDYEIDVSLTVSPRCGMHSYIFQNAEDAKVLLDLMHRDRVTDSYVKVVDEKVLEGYRFSSAWAKDQRIYFVAEFNRPFSAVNALLDKKNKVEPGDSLRSDSIQLSLAFDLKDGDEVFLKVGISAVSIEGARKNLEAEIPHWSFPQLLEEARDAWNKQLSKIEIFGGSRQQQVTFYTALYHTMIVPNLFNDVDGKYRGLDGEIYQDTSRNTYTVFSLWDTYRATHPLYTLIEEERTADFIETMLAHYDQSGLLPVWELAGNETNCMIGTHGVSVISDALVKGMDGFDKTKALEAMKSSLEQDLDELNVYRKFGYMPSNLVMESVSKTLEYAYDDWCLAQSAKYLGQADLYREYIQRAQYYKNVFDPSVGFMRPKLNGTWRTPFDPKQVDFNYTEANSWQYSFYTPQDVSGLIHLHGSEAAFERKLDELFSTDSQTTGRHQADITGLIGQYAHGNEPSHHMAYLYNYIGKPWKTQKLVEQILDEMYSDRPDGYSGNEDCGQMSAWYVMSALGFYPVTPGSDTYVIGKPMFPKAVINMENGKYFTIEGSQDSKGKFINALFLNKFPYDKSYIKHGDITEGGKLSFYFSDTPSERYGVDSINRPLSKIEDHPIVINPIIVDGQQSFSERYKIELKASDDNMRIYYRLRKEGKAFKKWKEYEEPLHVDYSGEIQFFAKDAAGNESKIESSSFVKMNRDWKVELAYPYSDQYAGGGEDGLVDLIRGGGHFADGSWQGFQGNDFQATVDLGETKTIGKISVGFLQNQGSWIWLPENVAFYLSNDGKKFKKIGEIVTEDKEKEEGMIIEEYEKSFSPQKTRFVRVLAKNRGVCPDWHLGAGGKSWLFVDEILIE